MRLRSSRSSTLLELMIAIIIFSMLALSFAVIEVFSNSQVITTDRRAKTQNVLVYVVEHSAKQIARTVGNPVIAAVMDCAAGVAGDTGVRFYVDSAADYISAGDGVPGTGGDHWRAYRFRSETAFPTDDRFQVWYCARCDDAGCTSCNTPWGSIILARRVTDVSYSYNSDNSYFDLSMTACWDPQQASTTADCGDPENPTVTMKTRVHMPAVSVR
ncbi:MAG: prepilin-type N-terminal cleavage/methylation domain-containing protein [Candidatus Omnitrophica bacterium]|nr:prepilin-type N-terminal cleavage/methylation domain-containing protein [Candidatus Omnitrophota bacterium]